MAVTGSPSSSPIRKPSGSAAWKHSASRGPGFQPSFAAQPTRMSSSGRVAVRTTNSAIASAHVDVVGARRLLEQPGFQVGAALQRGTLVDIALLGNLVVFHG